MSVSRVTSSALWMVLSVFLFALIVLAFIAQPSPTQAGPLPPRETPTPLPHGSEGNGGPVGAYIELSVQPAKPGLWAAVEWQDTAGNWHEVESWQGPLGATGSTYWWVAAKDFGTGPFRWHVANAAGGPALADSAPFTLPTGQSQTMHIGVSLP